jgi:hypothetical protein
VISIEKSAHDPCTCSVRVPKRRILSRMSSAALVHWNGFGVVVVSRHVGQDRVTQLRHTRMRPALQRPFGQQRKELLDQVEHPDRRHACMRRRARQSDGLCLGALLIFNGRKIVRYREPAAGEVNHCAAAQSTV